MKANARNGTELTLSNLCCTLLITCTLGGLFGYYAFGSPDTINTCYFADGETYPTIQENTENLNVGKRFQIFFIIGFSLMAL